MEYPLTELIDRAAIATVKTENGIPMKTYRDFLCKKIPAEEMGAYQKLVGIHRIIWAKEEMISAMYAKSNYTAAGKIYQEIRGYNIKRAKIKNKIAMHDNYFEDKKNFKESARSRKKK